MVHEKTPLLFLNRSRVYHSTSIFATQPLSELEVSRTIQETFKRQINALTVLDRGEAEIREYIKVSRCRPFVAKDQGYIVPKKSVFNKIIGDSHFELEFAYFLEGCEDVLSYVKNYFAVHFRIDYRNADGAISDFYPDFLVKVSGREVYIVETKGREDLDDPLKIARLRLWCEDVNAIQSQARYVPLYVKQEEYEKYVTAQGIGQKEHRKARTDEEQREES